MLLPRILLITSLLYAQLGAQLQESRVSDPLSTTRDKGELKRATDSTIKSTEVLIPSLKNLTITADTSSIAKLPKKPTQIITFHGLTEKQQSKVREALEKWINQPVTLDSLDRMARAAEQAASTNADSLLTATYPPQEITEGNIVMVISEPLLNHVAFAGKPLFGTKFLPNAILTRPGGKASAESIRKDIEFLNRNPFRKATALWSPAPDDIPAANLIIHINEKRPWSIYTGFDNYASDALGDERFYLGGRFGNVLNLDHRLGWLLLTTADGQSLHAGNLNYEIPLSDHKILYFSTGYSESSTSSPTTLVDNNGEFFSFRSMLEFPLHDFKNLRHHWKTGFSLRENQYRRGINQIDISIFQIDNIWEGELHDEYGHTSFSSTLSWNPGEAFISSKDNTYRSLGATDSDSWVATFKAERDWSLQKFGNLAITAEAQWTNENLIPSNQFAGGGAQHIRGYDEGEVFFDKALFLSTEWQFPRIKLPEKTTLRPHIFLDSAWLADHRATSDFLSSAGLGFQLTWQDHLSARFEIAQPFQSFNGANRNPELYFSINTFW